MGYDPHKEDQELVLENLEGTEDIDAVNEEVKFEFENEGVSIDKRQDQIFEEI